MSEGRFIEAGGVKTYFEEFGNGKPLVMLHGDGLNTQNFVQQIPPFSREYRMIVPERRGHGRSPDLHDEFTYDLFAKDVIEFIDALGVKNAHLLGNSGGADMALLVAINRPDLVDRLVIVSGESSLRLTSERKAKILSVTPGEFASRAKVVVEAHAKVAPGGRSSFPALYRKLQRLWTTDWEIPSHSLVQIRAPTLVMVADHDFGTVEEAAALSRSIPGAQLCVVPGADHGMMMNRAGLVNHVILDFLAAR